MTLAELTAAGFVVDAEPYQRLARFVSALLDENRKLNLTAVRTEPEAWAIHICDSLAVLPLLQQWSQGHEGEARRVRRADHSLLDLGSGGGVPGIPLACARPELHVTLLDAKRKKVAAAQRLADGLGLKNVSTVWGRAEQLACRSAYHEAFDFVTARAVAKLPVTLRYAARFVRPGGWCILYQSCRAVAEHVPAADDVARECGLARVETRPYALPDPHGQRVLVVYEKQPSAPANRARTD
ncbi:MAG: 16S rRNA (guanine(527)-N(7))-methyltransferase RsmG [Planctomycetes bacterium]|nr:16S rRNA (guanine(527)-N(7))-methyltransferase RsmG [Planctomycetota bacterium]